MPSSKPEGVAGLAPAAWRLSRTVWRRSPPRGIRTRWRGVARRESHSGSEVLSQMHMGRRAEGLRRAQRGRAAMGPRGRRDQTAGGGMAETRRRKCHSCREWMEETRRGILQAPGSIADAATPRHTARFCLMLLTCGEPGGAQPGRRGWGPEGHGRCRRCRSWSGRKKERRRRKVRRG